MKCLLKLRQRDWKTLGVVDLIILGVGAIIGSGIFAVVGIAAAGNVDGSIIELDRL
ncbi:MAG: hypothetical protein ACLSA2_11380 [Candidatus Gastranaerophilaceae bacterium]